jgi:hypothetical protein
MKDLTLFDENPSMARQIFLDILEAQQRRELCPDEEDKFRFPAPSIDPRDLFGNGSASRMDASVRAGSDEARNFRSVSISHDDSVFGSLQRDLLIWEGTRCRLPVMMN